jgi:predicted DNA-binding transcriptional regulator AlpA
MSMRLHAIVTANLPEATKEVTAPCGPISVSESTCWVGVKRRHFPKPMTLGSCTTGKRVKEIRALIPQPNARND